MIKIMPTTARCMCGQDADNYHIHTCPRISGGMKIHRHNNVIYALETWAQQLGFTTKMEPRTSTTNKQRMDILIHTPNGMYATDVFIIYPERVKQTSCGALNDQYRTK